MHACAGYVRLKWCMLLSEHLAVRHGSSRRSKSIAPPRAPHLPSAVLPGEASGFCPDDAGVDVPQPIAAYQL